VSIFPLDVSVESSFSKLAAAISESGVTSIDVLVANAGISGDRQEIMDTTLDNMTSVFNTNVLGTLLTFQASVYLSLVDFPYLYRTIVVTTNFIL
jgi:NAD(P)-dependent dehydrogenase (short-subunit alcohol dehydrogenase family)